MNPDEIDAARLQEARDESEPAYCYDERHEHPCPLPCHACEEECEPQAVSYVDPFTVPGEWVAGPDGSAIIYDDPGYENCGPDLSTEDEARALLGLPPSWRDRFDSDPYGDDS